jgi:hypothetical protein
MQKEPVDEHNETEISIEFGLLFDLILSKPIITSKHKIKNDNQHNKYESSPIAESYGSVPVAKADDTSNNQ